MIKLLLTLSLAALVSIAAAAQAPATPPAPASAAAAPAPTPEQIQRMQDQLKDWGNLEGYQSDNAALPPAPPDRVVFMGDSITAIWGRLPNTGTFFPGKPYVNRGISGQTTPQMLLRFQQDVIHLHPAVVLILSGTNDVAGNTGPETPQMIEDNWTSMATLAKANGIKVILASITPAGKYPWRPEVQPIAEIHELNEWLRGFCASNGYIYLDYFTAMANPDGSMKPGISSDGVHPNAQGFAIMAPLAQQAITKALSH